MCVAVPALYTHFNCAPKVLQVQSVEGRISNTFAHPSYEMFHCVLSCDIFCRNPSLIESLIDYVILCTINCYLSKMLSLVSFILYVFHYSGDNVFIYIFIYVIILNVSKL